MYKATRMTAKEEAAEKYDSLNR